MRFTADRVVLMKALAAVAPAAAGRTTNDALRLVKIEAAAGGGLTLSATDSEVSLRLRADGAAVADSGAVTADPGKLGQLLKGAADPDATLEAGGAGVVLRLGRGRFELPGGDPTVFPAVDDFPADQPHWTVAAGTLLDLIARGAFAAIRKEAHGTFTTTAVCLEFDGRAARVVSTDSRSLAAADGDAAPSGEGQGPTQVLCAEKTLAALRGCLADRAEPVRCWGGRGTVAFATGRAVLRGPQVHNTRFVPWRVVLGMAESAPVRLDLPLAAVLPAVERVAVVADAESQRVALALSPGRLALSASGATSGAGEEEVDLPGYAGPGVGLCTDAGTLREFLAKAKAAGFAAVEARLRDAESPLLLRAGDRWSFLISPVIPPKAA